MLVLMDPWTARPSGVIVVVVVVAEDDGSENSQQKTGNGFGFLLSYLHHEFGGGELYISHMCPC